MEPPTVPTAHDPHRAEGPAEILARIDAREREIERALHEAHEAAAAIVREARERVQALGAANREQAARAAAEQAARIEAEARREAEEILAVGAREAATIRATPEKRIARAAEGLLAVVLPPGRAREAGR